MSRPILTRNDRIAEMSKQEELIAKKRQEILEKQKTAELAKAVAAAQSEVSGKPQKIEESKPVTIAFGSDLRPKVQNSFCNDGSFLTHFKKILESSKEKEKKNDNFNNDTSSTANNDTQPAIEVENKIENLQPSAIDDENNEILINPSSSSPVPSQNETYDTSVSEDSSNSNYNSTSNLDIDSNTNTSCVPAPVSVNVIPSEPEQMSNSYVKGNSITNTFQNNNNKISPLLHSTQNYSELNTPSNNYISGVNEGRQHQQKVMTTTVKTTICNVNIPPPNYSTSAPPLSLLPSAVSSSQSKSHPLFPQHHRHHQQQQQQQQSSSLYYNPNIPPPILSTQAPPPPPPPPLCVPIYMIPPPEPLQLNKIPPPKELDLNAIPQPQMNLDAIKIPDLESNQINQSDNNDHILPTTLESLIELVADNGDAYEDIIRTRKNELQPTLWFLFDKDSQMYNDYRNSVLNCRQQKQYSINDNINKNFCNEIKQEENIIDEQQNIIIKNENVKSESNDEKYDPESVCEYREDSDDEYMKDIKERNLGNLKRKLEEKSENSQESYDDDDDDDDYDDNSCETMRTYSSTSSATTTPTYMSQPQTEQILQQQQQQQQQQLQPLQQQQSKLQQQLHHQSRQRKRKSRWGGKIDPQSSVITAVVQTNFANQNKPILSAVQRTDPALLQYARQNYGTINLSEEDWKKCEDHFKVNLLYQDMMRKRREIDQLAKSGKFKYEYDSDEDTTGGTWEHKLRTAEMEATKAWADALTQQSEGKHHIGDFLPPEELKKFMEKYEAKKNNRQPDLSDYKEYKLKEDNIGFQMLQKLGWKEGQGLGASGEGIVDPINKAPQRDANQGLGAGSPANPDDCDNEYDAYRKRMMLAYRFRPNPLNNPRRAYY